MDPLRHSHRKLFGCFHAPSKPYTILLRKPLGSLSPYLQRLRLFFSASHKLISRFRASLRLDQALDRLVLTSFCIAAFTPSTYLPCRLQGVLPACSSGNLFLEVGFTLRCFQRLSRPYFASQLCRWHDNCFTRGTSIPVLSY